MLKKIFNLQDVDKSGFISSSEVVLMSSDPKKLATYFEYMDKSKDGKVSLKEFSDFFNGVDKKQSIAHLYKWLSNHSTTINTIRSHWVESVDKNTGGKYTLRTPLFHHEVFRVLLHLNLNRQELSDLHQFLQTTTLLNKEYIYYGELLSLVCYWYS